MDYKKKSLNKLKKDESYEEIDTRLASGWYVDGLSVNNKKKYKTKEVLFKISKKLDQVIFFIFKTRNNTQDRNFNKFKNSLDDNSNK